MNRHGDERGDGERAMRHVPEAEDAMGRLEHPDLLRERGFAAGESRHAAEGRVVQPCLRRQAGAKLPDGAPAGEVVPHQGDEGAPEPRPSAGTGWPAALRTADGVSL